MNSENWKEILEHRDGFLYWKISPNRAVKPGDKAGTFCSSLGYWQVVFRKKAYYNHRIIWMIERGDIPKEMVIDHIDRNRANNHPSNLRCVSRLENSRNSTPSIVIAIKQTDDCRYIAMIGPQVVGTFDHIEEARAALAELLIPATAV